MSSGSSTLTMDDPSSVYFIHHSDNPGIVLVSQPLTGDDYASWSRGMTIALSVKNKLSFIDGSLLRPPDTDVLLLNSWIRNNNVVISWIINSISKEISVSILFSESARDIWLDLQERFQQSNGPRLFQLRRDLLILKQDNISIVRIQILLMDPLPPMNRVFSLVSQEEQQRKVGIPIENSSGTLACLAQHNYKRSNSNSASQTLGNTSRTLKCDRPFCTHCNFHGHTVDKCYKLHGYPPRYKPRPRIPLVVSGSINQVSTLPHPADPPQSPGNTVTSLNTTQCQQLIAMLSSQLSALSTTKSLLHLLRLKHQVHVFQLLWTLHYFSRGFGLWTLEPLDTFVVIVKLLCPCILSIIHQLLYRIMIRLGPLSLEMCY
ncbi:hypothetical protein DH2020_002704 [Rehmannia glutinosa]|uniref:Retrotransposon Copia-like N-terminal domain-containing protein n=1 Tax=Rehmannia glutinosa TaxID=99300 RepID=A0ABR0XUU3_REHGL